MHDFYFEQIKENLHIPARAEIVECPPTTFPAHWHEYIEILYLMGGSLTAVVQAESYHLSPGELVIINTKELHMTQTEGTACYLLLQISSDQMNRFFEDFESLHFQTYLSPHGSNPWNIPIFHSILEMLTTYKAKEDGYQILFTAKLYEFLYHLYKDYSQWEQSTAHTLRNLDFHRVTQTMNWVRKNFHDTITLDDASASLGISKEYFCRLFKKYTGQTFLEYLSSVRTMHFHKDLLQTDDKITLLMDKNGITNYKVFMRTFKKLYGVTPQQLRKDTWVHDSRS